MYNNNLDGWMFTAMKDYNHEQIAAKTRKSTLSGKLLAGVGGALVSVGTRLKGQTQPTLTLQTKEG